MTLCAVQAECGGCPLMPLSIEQQRSDKLLDLERCLSAFGVKAGDIGFTPSPRAIGYRNRIRLRIDPGGSVRFFNERKAPTCAVLESGLLERLAFVLDLSRSRPELFEPFKHLELRSDDVLGRPGLAFGGPESPRPLDGFLVGRRGDPEIACQKREIVEGVWTLVPLDGFLQVNAAVNRALVTAVRDEAQARGAATALDLFAGSGNFSLPLAAAGVSVSAVEAHAPSVRALAQASQLQGLDVEALAESAASACARLVDAGRRFDVVIVDAPRAGARETLSTVLSLGPRAVAVCSCNVKTLARDIAALVKAGFALEELHAFDMFPQTRHVEALAWLAR